MWVLIMFFSCVVVVVVLCIHIVKRHIANLVCGVDVCEITCLYNLVLNCLIYMYKKWIAYTHHHVLILPFNLWFTMLLLPISSTAATSICCIWF